MIMARFRIPNLCIFLFLIYSFTSVLSIYANKPEPVFSNKTNKNGGVILQTEVIDSQPQQIAPIAKNNLLTVIYFYPAALTKKALKKVKNPDSFFLLSIQKTIQYPSCKNLYLLIKVIIC